MGRPKKYQTEEELSQAIETYFAKTEESKEIANKAGLCHSLGISRETYSQYLKEYPDTIKETNVRLENIWIQRLASNAPTGAIFYMKNAFGYRDRQETDITTKGNEVVFSHGQILHIAQNAIEGTDSDGSSKGKE